MAALALTPMQHSMCGRSAPRCCRPEEKLFSRHAPHSGALQAVGNQLRANGVMGAT